MVKDAMIKTNMGEIPVVDYLDIRAGQLGYEDYNEMKADGLCLEEEKLLTPALENIILHIKYQEPINFNGFVVENDTITFDSQEELNNYVNGKAAYDVLDNCVKKNDNEILLYAENQKGNVVWGTKDLGGQYTETFDYSGFPYTVIDKWQNDAGILSIGELKADDGTRYAANVNDVTELFHGKYEYESPVSYWMPFNGGIDMNLELINLIEVMLKICILIIFQRLILIVTKLNMVQMEVVRFHT